MRIGKVIGNIWATRKEARLGGFKLMLVQTINIHDGSLVGEPIVATDLIDAGVGETVIYVAGSSARTASGNSSLPVDATIIAIVDNYDADFGLLK